MSILSVESVDGGYGNIQTFSDVHLHVDAGDYVIIVGPNGAGKSIVMKFISGLIHHVGGSIVYQGMNIEVNDTQENIYQE